SVRPRPRAAGGRPLPRLARFPDGGPGRAVPCDPQRRDPPLRPPRHLLPPLPPPRRPADLPVLPPPPRARPPSPHRDPARRHRIAQSPTDQGTGLGERRRRSACPGVDLAH